MDGPPARLPSEKWAAQKFHLERILPHGSFRVNTSLKQGFKFFFDQIRILYVEQSNSTFEGRYTISRKTIWLIDISISGKSPSLFMQPGKCQEVLSKALQLLDSVPFLPCLFCAHILNQITAYCLSRSSIKFVSTINTTERHWGGHTKLSQTSILFCLGLLLLTREGEKGARGGEELKLSPPLTLNKIYLPN